MATKAKTDGGAGDVRDATALERALAATMTEHGLRLIEVTWKRNLEKRTLGLGLKVTGDLDEQEALPFDVVR